MYPQHDSFWRRYLPIAASMCCSLVTCLTGCSAGMVAPLTISPQGASVRVGATLRLSVTQLGMPVTGALWSVEGGAENGSVSEAGLYIPPSTVPSTSVTVVCQAQSQTATTTIAVLNPLPAVNRVDPAALVEFSTPVTITGSGFVSGSQVLVGGNPVSTTFVDSTHLSTTLLVSSNSITSLGLTVSNPAPGAVVSSSFTIPVAIAPLTISPQSAFVRLGTTIAFSGMQLGTAVGGGVWSITGGSANGSITPGGVYTPPPSIPPANVTVTYQALGQIASSTLTIDNPVPVISQVTPARLTELSTPVVFAGSGFVAGSQILANGVPIPTTVVDSDHLSATMIVPSISVTSLSATVSNPNPGSISSGQVSVPVAIAPLTVSPSSTSVRVGNTVVLTGVQQGVPVGGGVWNVIGGATYGTIRPDGVYSPPSAIPGSSATASYEALGQTAYATITLLNPLPVVTQVSPSNLVQVSTPVTVIGAGFVDGSQILVGGVPIPTTFSDSNHLSGTISVSSVSVTSLQVSVSNPSPGPIISNSTLVPVAIAPLTISPPQASVRVGATLTLTGMQGGATLSAGSWSVTGGSANGTIDVNGIYTPPLSPPSSAVTVTYQAVDQTAKSMITVLNPMPTISQVSPAALTELNTTITVTGTGFVAGSRIQVNGTAIATTLVDSTHLSGTVAVSSISVSSLAIAVANPNPGAAVSSSVALNVGVAPLKISPDGASVRVGNSLTLSAQQSGVPVSGAAWTVNGGPANGSIDPNGVYSPPLTIQSSNVTITCQALGQTATTTISLLNPTPVIDQVSPSTLTSFNNPVTITGSGFIVGSQVLLGGVAIPTTFLDQNHLSAILLVSSNTITSVAISVSNPAPGAVIGSPLSLGVAIGPLSVSPPTVSGGNVTITASLSGLPTNSILLLNGVPLATTSSDTSSIQATGYLPFWKTGSATVAVASGSGASPIAQLDVPIAPTAVSYDTAARFAMQAGFGPRHDIIEHIQQVGLETFIDEQLQVPPDVYSGVFGPPQQYMLNVVNNNTQLRLRTAWAFQSFIPEQGIFLENSTLPWEQTLESHAFGNFRQILLDAASDPNVTTFLNLPGNSVSTDPDVHPNQNFARELLQLFSMGSLMLNDDGTLQTDASGNPMPAYDQNTILDISRALTGWNYGPTVNPAFSFFGIDYSQKLVVDAWRHDTGSKTIFGNISLPAGQTVTEDRDQVLDSVFQHQNVPAFVSRRLIQRFIKSQPTPAYIGRISAIFKDDGNGVRGNLAAVIKAILLDPEARAGDSTPSDDDGYVLDPLFAELFAMELMSIDSTDANASYYPGKLGEPWWFPPTVFAYYSPDYVIPGTTINSPEFQLLTTSLIVQRSQFLWGMINGPQVGFEPWGSTWLSRTFPTVPTLVEALNHIAYHGTMSQFEQETITNYCGNLPDQQSQLRCTLMIALNADSYEVVQ